MNETLSDEFGFDNSDDFKENKGNLMAFTSFVKSVGGSSENDPPILVESCDGSLKMTIMRRFVTTYPQRHNIVYFWLPKTRLPRRSLILVLLL
jgi:hypothetical protein